MYIELIIVIIVLASLIFIFKYNSESFYYTPSLNINGYNKSRFVLFDNAEFRGINMLGVNTSDGVIPVNDISECQKKCGDYVECKGFSYWPTTLETGNCYLFSSGNVIENCQGFKAGKKVDQCLE